MVKIVASTNGGPSELGITGCSPDLIELRLDLMSGDWRAMAARWREETDIPLVITLRSRAEGGRFSGHAGDWWEIVNPLLPFASYVDIEQGFSSFAPEVKKQGCTVVGSFHTMSMPSSSGLRDTRKGTPNLRGHPKNSCIAGNL